MPQAIVILDICTMEQDLQLNYQLNKSMLFEPIDTFCTPNTYCVTGEAQRVLPTFIAFIQTDLNQIWNECYMRYICLTTKMILLWNLPRCWFTSIVIIIMNMILNGVIMLHSRVMSDAIIISNGSTKNKWSRNEKLTNQRNYLCSSL